MSRVRDLIPGDLVTLPATGDSAVFLCQTKHPIWPHLQLVIWWVNEGMMNAEAFWSFDALLADQEIGVIQEANPADRHQQLLKILLHK